MGPRRGSWFPEGAGGGAVVALRPPRGLAPRCPGPAGRAWGAPSSPGTAGRGAHHARGSRGRRLLGGQAAARPTSPRPGPRGSGRRSWALTCAGFGARPVPEAPFLVPGARRPTLGGGAAARAGGRTGRWRWRGPRSGSSTNAEPRALPALFKESPDVSRAGPPSSRPALGPGPPPAPHSPAPPRYAPPGPSRFRPLPVQPWPAWGGEAFTPPGGRTPPAPPGVGTPAQVAPTSSLRPRRRRKHSTRMHGPTTLTHTRTHAHTQVYTYPDQDTPPHPTRAWKHQHGPSPVPLTPVSPDTHSLESDIVPCAHTRAGLGHTL